jgi:uncharacterized protein (DUF1697 family)
MEEARAVASTISGRCLRWPDRIRSGWASKKKDSAPTWAWNEAPAKGATTDKMSRYVALLRAVNVGGTGKLPMAELAAMCVSLGFKDVRTYIASGNVVFASTKNPIQVKRALEAKLLDYAGKPVGVVVRTGLELAAVLANNPFSHLAPNRVVAVFLDEPPPRDALEQVSGRRGEEMALGDREVYVHYGEGMADSKLKSPLFKVGTARNMNTIAKLVHMATPTA